MLVLSRKLNETIVVPAAKLRVQVVAIKPGVVRLGIDAPHDVAIVREELLPLSPKQPLEHRADAAPLSPEAQHAVRNRLSASSVGLALLRGQLAAGLAAESRKTLDRVDEEFRELKSQLERAFERPAPAGPKPKRALLVEDDHNERELLAGLLRLEGLQVDTAGDGADALDYLKKQGRPDFMVLDMVLPRCDGPTTLRRIRDEPTYRGLKIFVLSGHGPERFGMGERPTGIDRWFQKPLQPEAFLRQLREELVDRS